MSGDRPEPENPVAATARRWFLAQSRIVMALLALTVLAVAARLWLDGSGLRWVLTEIAAGFALIGLFFALIRFWTRIASQMATRRAEDEDD